MVFRAILAEFHVTIPSKGKSLERALATISVNFSRSFLVPLTASSMKSSIILPPFWLAHREQCSRCCSMDSSTFCKFEDTRP